MLKSGLLSKSKYCFKNFIENSSRYYLSRVKLLQIKIKNYIDSRTVDLFGTLSIECMLYGNVDYKEHNQCFLK